MPERFVVDAMLGRLARWLRALGHDTRYDPRGEDEELIRIAVAEGRILVTRDTRLAAVRRPGLRSFLVRANDHREQLREFRATHACDPSLALTRCLECNSQLEGIVAEEAQGSVPDYVLRSASGFKRCPGCGRTYWHGSHVEGMAGILGLEGEAR